MVEVEVEFGRHDWEKLRSFVGDSAWIASGLRALTNAETRESADRAFRAVEGMTLELGRMSESSVAVASCLVHALWKCSDEAEPYILELLSLIAGAEDDFPGSEAVGPVSHAECMRYIEAGFPFYCEVLELAGDESRIISAIDLVSACAAFNPLLRSCAKYVLNSAKVRYPSSLQAELIENSIADIGLCEITQPIPCETRRLFVHNYNCDLSEG